MRPMRMAVYGALMIQMIAGAPVWAQGRGHGKYNASDDRREHDGSPVQVHVVFSKGDTQVIREYYAPRHHRSLPPGLQKKYARTGKLPPGWQKKMRPIPVVVERRLPPLPPGYHRGVFDGHAVIYRPGGTIIDATVIF
jgi:hypothetical protein